MREPPADGAADSSILRRLEAAGRSPPRVRLCEDGDAADGAVAHQPIPLRPSSRYEILGEIARGGVGVILRGRDVDIGRDVAMKVLREEHAGSVELTRRFVEEAQVGGQLQHPGIVPVYELGVQPDGRPFFAMKLVKGGTLAAALAARGGPDEDRRRFLAVFEQVCQTMAYAHSRGVVHRDLKPSNVMIGAFGEVQVVDWGFAKVLAAGGVADEKRAKRETKGVTLVATVRSGSSGSGSLAGSVMGTPAYMPPEQALGQVDRVDERSDVFSLGAILCEVLTGRPPYTDDDLLGQARQCRLDHAKTRLAACGADDALVKLALACLAPLPKDRPKSAGEVAHAVSTYLSEVDERSHQSKLRSIEATAKAAKARAAAEDARLEAARRTRARRQTRAIAAAVLVAVVAGGGVWMAVASRRADRARTTAAAVDEAVQDATRLAAAQEWTKAIAAADRARELAASGDASAETVARAEALLSDVKSRETAARDAAAGRARDAAFLAQLEELRSRQSAVSETRIDSDLADAFRSYGIDFDGAVDPSVAVRIRERGAEFAAQVAVALDTWVHARRTFKTLAGRDPSRLVALARMLDDDPWRGRLRDAVLANDVDAMRTMALSPEVLDQPARTIALLAVSLGSRALAGDRNRTGGERAAAVDLLRRAHVRHAGDFWINFDAALYMFDLGREHAKEAVRHAAAAYALRPDSWRAADLLAAATHEAGDPRRAVALAEHALRRYPSEAGLWTTLCFAKSDIGDAVGAEAAAREALRLDPAEPRWRANVVTCIQRRGDAGRALREAQSFVSDMPNECLAHATMGALKWQAVDLDGAEAAYREALRCDPREASAHTWLSEILGEKGDLEGAVESAQTAVQLEPYRAGGWQALGNARWRSGALGDALTSLEKAIALGNLSRANQAVTWSILARVHGQRGDAAEEGEALRRAVEAGPADWELHYNLGQHLARRSNWDDALAEYRTAIRLAPGEADPRLGAGDTLVDKRDFAGAIVEFRECAAALPEDPRGLCGLGRALRLSGDLSGAMDAEQKALGLDPSGMNASCARVEIGRIHWASWRFAEATAEFAAAIEAAPGSGDAQRELGRALAALGRAHESIEPLREAVRLMPDDPLASHDLAQALQAQGEFAEALGRLRVVATLAAAHPQVLAAGTVRAEIENLHRLIRLEETLDAVLDGKAKPKDAAELDAFVRLGGVARRYAAVVRLAKDAFAGDARLADDPKSNLRYNAACAAVRAAAGDGDDADRTSAEERAAFRKLGLAWLRAEVVRVEGALTDPASGGAPAAQSVLLALRHDPDLVSVRDEAAIEKLPAAERADWRALWKDVGAAFEKLKAAGPR